MRDFLRSLPVFAGVIHDFDADAVPDDPAELFASWLRDAVQEGVPEPHAMTLSTSDLTGAPDARTLILKDLDEQGWWFATSAESIKGIQLSAADFRSRGTGARAVALASRESQPLDSRAACAQAVAAAGRQLAADPDLAAPSWGVYAVVAHTVEFWQADKDRQHIRVQYRRGEPGWARTLLWP